MQLSNCTSGSKQYFQTSYGCLNTIAQPGETIIAGNIGTGPAAVAVNLRVSRSFGIGPKLQSAIAQNPGGGPGGPGGPGRASGGRRWWPWRRRRLVDSAAADLVWWAAVAATQATSTPQLQRAGTEPVQRYRPRATDRDSRVRRILVNRRALPGRCSLPVRQRGASSFRRCSRSDSRQTIRNRRA